MFATAVVLVVDGRSGTDARVVERLVALRSDVTLGVAKAVTTAGVFWLLLVVAAVFVVAFRRSLGWRAAATPALSLVVASFVAQVLKQCFDRQRPPLELRAADAAGWAFPSGHATNAAAFFGCSAIVLLAVSVRVPARRVFVAGVAGLFVLLVGTSRVVLAVHWPSDVLAGWALGLFVASSCSFVMLRGPSGGTGLAAAPEGTDGLVRPALQRLDQRA